MGITLSVANIRRSQTFIHPSCPLYPIRINYYDPLRRCSSARTKYIPHYPSRRLTLDAKLPLKAFLAFWFAIFVWSLWFIFANGRLYVSWPRLVPLDFAPDLTGFKRDKIAALEKGEGRGHKRELSVGPPKGPAGIFGALFGRWAPGKGGGEEMELVGIGKDGRAHAE